MQSKSPRYSIYYMWDTFGWSFNALVAVYLEGFKFIIDFKWQHIKLWKIFKIIEVFIKWWNANWEENREGAGCMSSWDGKYGISVENRIQLAYIDFFTFFHIIKLLLLVTLETMATQKKGHYNNNDNKNWQWNDLRIWRSNSFHNSILISMIHSLQLAIKGS